MPRKNRASEENEDIGEGVNDFPEPDEQVEEWQDEQREEKQTYTVLTEHAIIGDMRCKVGDEVTMTDTEAKAHRDQGVALSGPNK